MKRNLAFLLAGILAVSPLSAGIVVSADTDVAVTAGVTYYVVAGANDYDIVDITEAEFDLDPTQYFVYTTIDDEIIKICDSYIGQAVPGECGEITNLYKNGIGIKCSDKEIIITKVKPNGKKEMNASDYINGKRKENLLHKKFI